MVQAKKLCEQEGLTYINGYNDPAIIAGQGTAALEILEQVADVDAIVVPVGGGGLIAGQRYVVMMVSSRSNLTPPLPLPSLCPS